MKSIPNLLVLEVRLPHSWRRLRALFGALVIAFCPALAGAQEREERTVAVLGIESPDGDDGLALALTSALREGLRDAAGWDLAPAEVSLGQMLVMHSCNRPSLPCMARVAATLSAPRVLFGEFRRDTERDAFTVTISMYNARRRRIERRLEDVIPEQQFDEGQFEAFARRYLAHVTGASQTGWLRLQLAPGGDPIEAERFASTVVLIDDEAYSVSAEGWVEAELASGSHALSIRVPGYRTLEQEIDMAAGRTAWITPELTPEESDLVEQASEAFGADPETQAGVPSWLPWVLVGTAGASAIATALLWLEVDSIGPTEWFFFIPIDAVENDERVDLYRTTPNDNFPGLDFCDAAGRERNLATVSDAQQELAAYVDDECGRASLLQLVSVITVTLTVAAAAGAVVAFLDPWSDEPGALSVTAQPMVSAGPNGAIFGLEALVRY